jgi:hypothetical protein
MMSPTAKNLSAGAQVVAYVMARNGYLDERELSVLGKHDAFRAFHMKRAEFAALARRRAREIDGTLRERSWMPSEIETSFDELLDAVADEDVRRSVCRLVLALVEAETKPGYDHHLLIGHMCARWRVCRDAPSSVLRPSTASA